jgi:hypothetical protein
MSNSQRFALPGDRSDQPLRPFEPGFAFILRSPHGMRDGRAVGEASPDFIRTTIVAPDKGAERRETLVRNAAPLACHDAARQGHLARRPAPNDAGRSPRDAPPRRLTIHGPDAGLLRHHSLGIAAQTLGHSAQGRVP